MIAASSRFDAPRASSDRSMRSRDTVGSPASIFATRDWLDLMDLAISTWVTPCACRRAFMPAARRMRSSTYAASSSDRPSKSLAVPIRHPLLSSLFRLLSRIFILLKAATRCVDHLFGGRSGLLGENLKNHYRIAVNAIDDSLVATNVRDPQLMALPFDARHRCGLRHSKGVSALQLTQQEACLNRAALDNGGVLISPCSQTRGLSLGLTRQGICQN